MLRQYCRGPQCCCCDNVATILCLLVTPSTQEDIGAKIRQKCQKSCKSTQYIATILNPIPLRYLPYNSNHSFALSYTFAKNELDVKQEYLIVDAITMIGSVGGTLGLFIGFSFVTCLSSIIETLKHFVKMLDDCLQNRQKKSKNSMEGECP